MPIFTITTMIDLSRVLQASDQRPVAPGYLAARSIFQQFLSDPVTLLTFMGPYALCLPVA